VDRFSFPCPRAVISTSGRRSALPLADNGSRASAGAHAHTRAIPIVRHRARRTGPARSPRRRSSRPLRAGGKANAIVRESRGLRARRDTLWRGPDARIDTKGGRVESRRPTAISGSVGHWLAPHGARAIPDRVRRRAAQLCGSIGGHFHVASITSGRGRVGPAGYRVGGCQSGSGPTVLWAAAVCHVERAPVPGWFLDRDRSLRACDSSLLRLSVSHAGVARIVGLIVGAESLCGRSA
jgi:hypothetical protein